jgi:hypothetical protein
VTQQLSKVRSHAWPCAFLLASLACSSATGPRPGVAYPNGLFLTTVVHDTLMRVGDTTTVDLVLLNTTSQPIPFATTGPVPTLTIRDANGDTIAVAYPGNPQLTGYEGTFEPHKSSSFSIVLGAGNVVTGAAALANLTPGVYSVAACMASCGQPVSITINQ